MKGILPLFSRRSLYVLVLLILTATSCSIEDALRKECSIRLDEDILSRLQLAMQPTIEMQPGDTRELSVGTVECCTYFEPVDACVTWSVEPTTGASISRDGELSIDSSVESGAEFVVTADVENGRRLVSIDVVVFDPLQNPLVGMWREELQMACDGSGEVSPAEPIRELRFFADGRVNVTWMPFETYVDYWGTYTLGSDGSIEITVEGGNYVPDDLDQVGTFQIDEGSRLRLEEMWLGSPPNGGPGAHCGHVFVRQD